MQLARENYGTGRYGIRGPRGIGVSEERIKRTDVVIPTKFMSAPETKLTKRDTDGIYGVGRDNITTDRKHVYQTAVGVSSRGTKVEIRTKRIATALLMEAVPDIKLSEEYIEMLAGKIGLDTRYKNDCQIGPSLPARRTLPGIGPTTPGEIDMDALRALARVSPRPVVLPTPEADLFENTPTIPMGRVAAPQPIEVRNVRVLPIPGADFFDQMKTTIYVRVKAARREVAKFGASLTEEFLGEYTPLPASPRKEEVGVLKRIASWVREQFAFSFETPKQATYVPQGNMACPTYTPFMNGTKPQKTSSIPTKFYGEGRYSKFTTPEPTTFERIGEVISTVFSGFAKQN